MGTPCKIVQSQNHHIKADDFALSYAFIYLSANSRSGIVHDKIIAMPQLVQVKYDDFFPKHNIG